MSSITVRTTGLKEVRAAFRKMDADLPKRLNRELTEIGKPVAEDARGRLERYGSSVPGKIRPRVKGNSLYVESRARSKGIRPNFGVLVMAGIVAAADSHIGYTVEAFGRMIDRLARDNGFKT